MLVQWMVDRKADKTVVQLAASMVLPKVARTVEWRDGPMVVKADVWMVDWMVARKDQLTAVERVEWKDMTMVDKMVVTMDMKVAVKMARMMAGMMVLMLVDC